MIRSALAVLTALCATLVLGACGTDQAADDPAGAPSDDVEETMSESPDPTPAAPTPQARQAVADLAQRLGVPEDQVEVESVEEVTWRDGSLGCAEKGTMYTQALVDGSRITLRAEGETYEYHAGGSRSAFLCERPTE